VFRADWTEKRAWRGDVSTFRRVAAQGGYVSTFRGDVATAKGEEQSAMLPESPTAGRSKNPRNRGLKPSPDETNESANPTRSPPIDH
jgi:hypothetical protein